MKLRFLKFFLIAFVLLFAVLNGRFLYANVRFALSGSSAGKAEKLEPFLQTTYVSAKLIIEKIDVSVPVVFDAEDNQKSIYANLEKGVVNYPGSSKPGENGTSIVLGHSSAYPWYKGSYGSVFALLGKLKPGDTFRVEYANGKTLSYSVKQTVVFSPFKNERELAGFSKDSKSSVVLISCWPIGTNYRRIAVRAELI